MPGIGGNVFTVGIGRQTAKGTASTTMLNKLKLRGGNLLPTREIIQVEETDASRQQGASIVVGGLIQGTLEHYVRPVEMGILGYASMGTVATSGTTPNFTHTLTPATSAPYFTLWKNIGAGVLIDKYHDCVCTGLHLSGGAGAALSVGADWTGIVATLNTTEPSPPTPSTATPLTYPQVVVNRAGAGSTGKVENFSLDIVNGGEVLRGDNAVLPYDYVWGKLLVTGSLTVLFETDDDYNKFLSGTTAGTALTTTLATESLSILSSIDANTSIELVMAGITMTSYEIGPDPGGSPIRAAIGFASLPQTVIGDYIKLIVKNGDADPLA